MNVDFYLTTRRQPEKLAEYLKWGLRSCPRHLAEPRHPPTESTRR